MSNHYTNDVFQVTFGEAGSDAFARFRTSEPLALFSCDQTNDAAPLLFEDVQVSGTATSTHSTARASSTLAVLNGQAGLRRCAINWCCA